MAGRRTEDPDKAPMKNFKKEFITQELLKRCFTYKNGELYYTAKNFKGKKAGGNFKDHLGYMRIAINRRRFLKHRVIFLFHHGYLPECVDHIDHNPSNNRIENLRAATKAENCAYRDHLTRNKHGYFGIKKTNGTWKAELLIEGVNVSAGQFKTKIEAARMYDRMVIGLNREFARNTNFPRSDYE